MPYKEDYNRKMAEYMQKRYHLRRAEAFEYLGGQCVVCDTKDNLEIDHINAEEKTIALNKMWAIARKRFFAELDKCQLLCKQHHLEKSGTDHGKQGYMKHGTLAMYRRCKCSKCKAAKAAYYKEWKANREGA